jgi:FkbM family methyltransferase
LLPPLSLGRTADFMRMHPSSLVIGGREIPISIPDEVGVRHALMEVLLEDGYSLRKIRTPICTVLDIGANVGMFCLAARNAFPEAVIHAYEPNPNLRPFLEHQAESTGSVAFFEAVQLRSGAVSLQFTSESVATTTTMDAAGEIPATSFRTALDRLADTVDFVKLDCEGAEWEILEDTEAWQRVRRVAMEYHCFGEHTHDTARDRLQSLGFRILAHRPGPEPMGIIYGARH